MNKILLGNAHKWLATLISYILRCGKVFVKCYVVIDHIATVHTYQTNGIAFKLFLFYSYIDKE